MVEKWQASVSKRRTADDFIESAIDKLGKRIEASPRHKELKDKLASITGTQEQADDLERFISSKNERVDGLPRYHEETAARLHYEAFYYRVTQAVESKSKSIECARSFMERSIASLLLPDTFPDTAKTDKLKSQLENQLALVLGKEAGACMQEIEDGVKEFVASQQRGAS